MAGMEPEKEDHEKQLEDVDRETTHLCKKRKLRDVDGKTGFLLQVRKRWKQPTTEQMRLGQTD
jgi:hypothetical protein